MLSPAWIRRARPRALPGRRGGTAAPPSVSDFGSPHAHSIFVASFVVSFVAFDPDLSCVARRAKQNTDPDSDIDIARTKWISPRPATRLTTKK